jgi:hypothetical protein
LLKAGQAESLTGAQLKIARTYGFSNWPKLKAHIEQGKLDDDTLELKNAIDINDLDRVKLLMTRNRALHRTLLGYSKNGPLTWVAECRVPWEPPTPVRLAMAQWMIENGSDVHGKSRSHTPRWLIASRRSGIRKCRGGSATSGARCGR